MQAGWTICAQRCGRPQPGARHVWAARELLGRSRWRQDHMAQAQLRTGSHWGAEETGHSAPESSESTPTADLANLTALRTPLTRCSLAQFRARCASPLPPCFLSPCTATNAGSQPPPLCRLPHAVQNVCNAVLLQAPREPCVQNCSYHCNRLRFEDWHPGSDLQDGRCVLGKGRSREAENMCVYDFVC